MLKINAKVASDVKEGRVEWLIDGVIPRNRVSIIDGDPGQGKSFITLEIAAAVTRGQMLTPKGRGKDCAARAAHAIVMNAEDDEATTLVPRARQLGALMGLVTLGCSVGEVPELRRQIYLPEDKEAIRNLIRETSAKLLVIDPVMGFLSPFIKANSDQAVRIALGPLKELAELEKITIILVRHLNKSAGTKVLYRGGGSIGIIGLTRAAVYVGPNPEDKTQRVFAPVKNNLGPLRKPWLFRFIETADGSRKIHWEGEADIPLSRLLDTRMEALPIERAMAFLHTCLDGKAQVAITDVMTAAEQQGLTASAVVRGKRELGVKAHKTGAIWYWSMPDAEKSEFDRLKGE